MPLAKACQRGKRIWALSCGHSRISTWIMNATVSTVSSLNKQHVRFDVGLQSRAISNILYRLVDGNIQTRLQFQNGRAVRVSDTKGKSTKQDSLCPCDGPNSACMLLSVFKVTSGNFVRLPLGSDPSIVETRRRSSDTADVPAITEASGGSSQRRRILGPVCAAQTPCLGLARARR